MKKLNYLLGALALAGFVACSSNEEVASVEGLQQKAVTSQSIGFSPLSKGATRTSLIKTTSDITSFKVRGTWNSTAATTAGTNKLFVNGEEVTSPTYTGVYGSFGEGVEIVNNNGWNYKNAGDTQYWPFTQNVSGTTVTGYACLPLDFNAVTPANAAVSLASPTMTDYIVPAVANMVDICYAKAESKTNADAPVQLQFNHAFCQIVVKAKKADGYDVEIREVTIGGVNSKGTLSLNSLVAPTTNTSTGSSTGTQWGSLSTPTSYTGYSSATAYSVPSSAASESPTQMTPSGQELLLLPQSITAWDHDAGSPTNNDKGGYIKIVYRAKKSTESWTSDTFTTTYFPLTTKWLAGKIYAYTLLFGGVSDPDKPTTTDPENPDPGSGGDDDDNPGGYDENGTPKAPSVPITFTASVTEWQSEAVDVNF